MKNIVVCCDGTNNEITSDATNVLRLFCMLARDERQIAYYDAGVGTHIDPAAITRRKKLLSKQIDGALGLSVRENVCQAYQFLSRVYRPGDRIFLFGFSRGAYTVRALAGMIHFLGLVRPELEGLTPLAWAVYADDDQSLPVSRRFQGGHRFRNAFSIPEEVPIHFLGVWDTVSSFGFFWNFRTLPNTANNPSLQHVRHALAIDERRSAFQANLLRPAKPQQHLSFKQVWFAGVHSDVGGGYEEAQGGLSFITLQWMLREARLFDLYLEPSSPPGEAIAQERFVPDPSGILHDSLTGYWKFAEWLPRRVWNGSVKRMKWIRPHPRKPRYIEDDSFLHRSVVDRLSDASLGYSPPNLPKHYLIED